MKNQIIGSIVIIIGVSVLHGKGVMDAEGAIILLFMALPAWVIANAG
jgi:hypothetical protein